MHSSTTMTTKYLKFKGVFWVSLCLILVITAIIFGLQQHRVSAKHKGLKALLPSVVVAMVTAKDIPIYLHALGSVTPNLSVTIKTQINGTLKQVFFDDGQLVKAGDMLAAIDDRPYKAQLMQNEGQLTRDQAQLANAQIDLKRDVTLWKLNSVSQQTLNTQQALVKQLEGTIQIDEGLLEAAKINLSYTKIIAPINGRIGLGLVDPGNYVQTSDSAGIAVINMLNPITVLFSIPEDDIPDVIQKVYAGELLNVEAYDRQQNQLLATGKLLALDNQIDPTTGTIKLKAQFKNEDDHLFPSQFVNIRLLVQTLHNATTVPTAALQNGATGTFVYVLNKEDMHVKVTPIVVDKTMGDIATIHSGLRLGQLVITGGTDKLFDGATVTMTTNAFM